MKPSEKEWFEWAHHPMTQQHLRNLKESVEDAKSVWAERGYTAETAEATALANAYALGSVSALKQLVEQIEEYAVKPEGEE